MSGGDPRRRRLVGFALAGAAASALAIAVLVRFDRGGGGEEGRAPTAIPSDLPELAPLTDDERRDAARGIEAGDAVALERGAWVQVAAPDGGIEQEYRADRVDPLPDGWVRLERPQAILYRKDGRVVTLTAARGLARIAGRALESGSLEETVRIRLFPSSVAMSKGTPDLTVDASDATFDGVLGEIRTDGAISVRSGESRFDGEGLLLRIEPEGGGVERLVIDRATAPAVLVRRKASATSGQTVSPASTPTPTAPGTPTDASGASAVEERTRFYRLVLTDRVVIHRWLGARRTDLSGERLEAVFSLEKAQAGNLIASSSAPAIEAPPVASAAAPSVEGAVAAMALAAIETELPELPGGPPAEGDEIATVSFAGPLTLVPIGSDEAVPGRADAVEAMLAGAPATLVDSADGATVTAARLRFRSIDDSVLAEGEASRPLAIESPRLSARGRAFSLSRRDGKGTFTGPGEVRLGEGGEQIERLASDPARPLPEAGAAKEVTIAFGEAVDLELDQGAGSGLGPLRAATFRGGVEATGEDFAVSGDLLAAGFATGDATSRLSDLRIEGVPVRASRRGNERGTLLARRLVLSLGPDADGSPAPDRLQAEGGVVAADDDQALRAERLAVGFVETAKGDREVGPVTAEGEVAIALADGVRAWGGRLEADAVRRVVAIEDAGHPDGIAIVRDATLVDRVRRVDFAEEGSVARADGGGRVRAFASSLVGDGLEPGPRPAAGADPTLLGEWNGELSFRETDEGGELDLAGRVRVRSTPDRSATDALDAEAVRLVLEPKRAPGEGGDRPLRAFVARGGPEVEARLESRRWSDAARQGDPRLFRLTGREIRYRPPTREGEVPGAGTLLVHQPAESGSSAEVAAGGVTLGADGTTRFRWSRGLSLRAVGATDRFRVDLDGEVEVLHAGIGDGKAAGDTFSMRADRLGVDLERAATAGGEGVDLGGTAEILGLDAAGRVTVRTGRLDLECGSFRFDAATRVATVTAAEGRDVTVVFRDGTPPIRAAEVRWDLARGELKATRVSGGR